MSEQTGFTQREARALVRKAVARVPEGESIRHLNIMPMMDMMTILLVAFIFQISTSALDVVAGTVSLPRTEVDAPLPDTSWTLVITPTGIVVEGKTIVPVLNGDVDPGEKQLGEMGREIPKLTNFIAALRNEELKKIAQSGKDPSQAKEPEIMIIADRMTPYNLLLEVMYSAQQAPARFKHFRLIVEKNFPPRAAGGS